MTAGIATGAASLIPIPTALARTQAHTRGQLPGPRQSLPIGLSTYSLWRFNNDELRSMDRCIDLADQFGFDGIEFLLYQVGQNELLSRSRLMSFKRRAQRLGLPQETRCALWAGILEIILV